MFRFLRAILLTLLVVSTNFTAEAAVIFSLRGDSLTPRYAAGGKSYTLFLEGGSLASPPLPVTCTDPTCFGGWAIEVGSASNYRQILYPAKGNWVRNTKVFSLRVRAAPFATGTPASDVSPVRIGQLNQATTYGGARLVWQDNNLLRIQAQPKQSVTDLFLDTSVSLSLTSGVFKDYMLVSNGTNWYMSIDGVQVATGTVGNSADANYDLDWNTAGHIILGQYPFRGWINELTIWDTAESHVYTPRTEWLSVADFDGTSYSDPGVANVRSGTSYTQAGVSLTGTASIPAASDVKTGVAVGSTTGSYTGADRWTCPLAGQLALGVTLQCNSTTTNLTGTREVVTNVLSSQTMTGSATSGVLVAR